MGRHSLNPKRPKFRQWSCAPLPKRAKAHPGRWATGAAAGVGVLAATFWGTPPMAPGQALQLASPGTETGSTRVPELLPGPGVGLRPVQDLGLVLDAGVMSSPELLRVALAEPLHTTMSTVTIEVHPAGGHGGPVAGHRPPVVRPPCPSPTHDPAGYRAWWARWFPHHPLPTPSSPAETPPVTEAPAPTPAPQPEPTPEPQPEPTSAPEPTSSPEPEPTSTPEPTHEPEPTSEPEPAQEDEPEPTHEEPASEDSSDSDGSDSEPADSSDSSDSNDSSDSDSPDSSSSDSGSDSNSEDSNS